MISQSVARRVGMRMRRLRSTVLFLRGLRWRRGFSAAVLLVATISAALAAIGPLYARASSESTLTDELRDARWHTGLAFTAFADARDADASTQVDTLIGPAAHVRGYGTPIHGRSLAVTAKTPSNLATSASTLAWREDECAHLRIVSGHCPTAAGQALIPEGARHESPSWSLGERLTIHQALVAPDGLADGPVIGQATIVGSYRPKDTDEAYWFGLPYFASELGP